jgi:short-subunit dehydrogenase
MIALVTGASSGIGEAAARRLAREDDATLVLVARREDRLRELAAQLPRADVLALDLTDEDAPARVRAHLEGEHGGRLDLLVNNAGAGWGGRFARTGWEEVARTMAINFSAPVRLTEALLPLLRASAPSAIVNVSSVAGRVARARSGAYNASKHALTGWSDALAAEEHREGVHVGLVLPGFVATEGFTHEDLRAKPWTRWMVGRPDQVADAIADVGLGRRPERYVPRWYGAIPPLRLLAAPLVRRSVRV